MSPELKQALAETGIKPVSHGTISVTEIKRQIRVEKLSSAVSRIRKAKSSGFTSYEIGELRVNFRWKLKKIPAELAILKHIKK